MELYYKYQPVTWYVGVIEAPPKEVAGVVQPRYIPNDELIGIYQEKVSIEEGLALLEPLGSLTKFLLAETIDGKTVLFNNHLIDAVELPTWNVTQDLGVPGYCICNVPNTIASDHMSGMYGARKVEYRIPGNTIVQEPTFGIHLINDSGRWCFYRYGDKLPFEDEKAYKSRRKTDRFTEEMLVEYCRELGIPVYDRNWYANNIITIHRSPICDEEGVTYNEAAKELRIEKMVL